ncbi:hypothetical protein TW78_09465 [Vibrio coralliilyticus]|uniref:Uncharacterized protein n=2 Tax=Vibrio coralliilyticus TaxID=190893 RepID=A0A837G9X6_9VIBR|nr:hypothetical protein B6A42_25745 [Vibrio coralliilyticus]KJY73519.1 hypothetical protein TW78_09465 [Vibrio coralliilyticus]QOU33359.1 hypothetical protein TW71_024760 [Vibrio coralliilyticus]
MNLHDYLAHFIQSTYKQEKVTGGWARLFYLTPTQRIQRLNELFETDQFWHNVEPNSGATPDAEYDANQP